MDDIFTSKDFKILQAVPISFSNRLKYPSLYRCRRTDWKKGKFLFISQTYIKNEKEVEGT